MTVNQHYDVPTCSIRISQQHVHFINRLDERCNLRARMLETDTGSKMLISRPVVFGPKTRSSTSFIQLSVVRILILLA